MKKIHVVAQPVNAPITNYLSYVNLKAYIPIENYSIYKLHLGIGYKEIIIPILKNKFFLHHWISKKNDKKFISYSIQQQKWQNQKDNSSIFTRVKSKR